MINGAERMRREMLIRVVRDFMCPPQEEQSVVSSQQLDEQTGAKNSSLLTSHSSLPLAARIDRIPLEIRPKESAPSRCCIYHDRAVIKYGLQAMMGLDYHDETDELAPLSGYLQNVLQSDALPEVPLTVCEAGCNGCPDSRIYVTSNCQGCFARPCTFSCPKQAITVINQRATVDYSKCIKCGKCIQVCPFNAIVKTTVPCEEACPVGAIHKNEKGVAEIDFTKCIFCGKCFAKCPFGAVMERSHLLKVLYAIKRGKNVVAMIAPSAQPQFPGGLEKLFTAVLKAGFSSVMEVALGAEMTTQHEAKEFVEKMSEGQKLMTTSCCPAYVQLVKKHLPSFEQFVSTTPSPMKYAGQIVKEKEPEAVTVFIGPCIAKRHEALSDSNIDFVLTFEELGAILAGMKIDVMSQDPAQLERPAAATARNFMKSCGVTDAVLTELADAVKKPDGEDGFKLKTEFIDGIDKKTVPKLKMFAGPKSDVNFLEVMACCGGCINGPCSLVK